MDLQPPSDIKKQPFQTGVYLDYNATTPLDPAVFAQMEPYFKEFFGNPASAGHHWGWTAEHGVQKARMQVASLIGAKSSEITFTGGATEANNWVIFGLLSKLREEDPQAPIHFITSTVEHSSIMKAMKVAESMGVEVDFLPVNKFGQVEIETLKKALKPHTKLMSFIWVNNEIGSINPIPEIARLAKEHQIYLHTDATQAIGKIPVQATEMGIDLMSFSGHKIYGPKGVGALYIRSSQPKVQINPLIYGGGHEKGLRSGTLNVPAIVGLGAASDICQKNLETESAHLTKLRQYLWSKLQAVVPDLRLNGHPTERSPINLNITFPGHRTDSLIPHLQKVGLSTGSACSSGTVNISHVLRGIGISEADCACSLRLSLGRWTTEAELDFVVERFKAALGKKNS